MADNIIPSTRRCKKCGVEKPLTKQYFHYNQQHGRKPSYRVVCIDCIKASRRKTPPKPIPPEGFRYCTMCHQMKPATEEFFRPQKRYKGGISSWCRDCSREWDTEWKRQHPDAVKQWKQTYRATPEYQITRKKYEQSEGYIKSQLRYRAKPEAKAVSRMVRRTRRGRVASLPNTVTPQDWLNALAYFDNRCAVCGRPAGLWHTLAMDHWIPVASPSCPGTVPSNIVPLCHGVDGCNNSKYMREPAEWLESKFGKRKAKVILARINGYFESLNRPCPTKDKGGISGQR